MFWVSEYLGYLRYSFSVRFRDNPESDIYGANLYHRSLQKRLQVRKSAVKPLVKQKAARQPMGAVVNALADDSDDDILEMEIPEVYAERCESILVCTGVYHSAHDYVSYGKKRVSNHNHRDFVLDPLLTEPNYISPHVLDAVKLVFQKENYSPS